MTPSKKPNTSLPPSNSFHGSNSSHSKDNGSGGRTYHIPNYATSYANERSSVISVTFDEDKGTPRAIIAIVVIFLLFAIIPLFLMTCKTPKHMAETQKSVEGSTPTGFHSWSTEKIHSEKGTFKPKINVDNIRPEDESTQDRSVQNLFWSKPQPNERCASFGTKEYTARLWNLPLFADRTEICKNTKAKIHGVSLKPSYCESKWPFGGVVGHWLVDFNEEDCNPHWGKVVDKGCPARGSKTRRFQSRLWNIKYRQDWGTLCETAPANFQNLKNATPKFCDDRGIWGIYGIWEVDDPNC